MKFQYCIDDPNFPAMTPTPDEWDNPEVSGFVEVDDSDPNPELSAARIVGTSALRGDPDMFAEYEDNIPVWIRCGEEDPRLYYLGASFNESSPVDAYPCQILCPFVEVIHAGVPIPPEVWASALKTGGDDPEYLAEGVALYTLSEEDHTVLKLLGDDGEVYIMRLVVNPDGSPPSVERIDESGNPIVDEYLGDDWDHESDFDEAYGGAHFEYRAQEREEGLARLLAKHPESKYTIMCACVFDEGDYEECRVDPFDPDTWDSEEFPDDCGWLSFTDNLSDWGFVAFENEGEACFEFSPISVWVSDQSYTATFAEKLLQPHFKETIYECSESTFSVGGVTVEEVRQKLTALGVTDMEESP